MLRRLEGPWTSMAESIYVQEGEQFVPTRFAQGPWGSRWQHGSAATALSGVLLARNPADDARPIARLSVDFLGTVPLRPMTAATEILRSGRRTTVGQLTLMVDERPVVRATALRMRDGADLPLPDTASQPSPAPPLPEEGRDVHFPEGAEQVGFREAVDVRFVHGDGSPGPAGAWFRLKVPILDGDAISPLCRALAAADFGNGVAAPLPFDGWRFVNPDLTVHLDRHPGGEWVHLQARSFARRSGVGRSESRLSDADGCFGLAVQTLLIEGRE
jgi:hypothetical protein